MFIYLFQRKMSITFPELTFLQSIFYNQNKLYANVKAINFQLVREKKSKTEVLKIYYLYVGHYKSFFISR